jgi:macrolide transport system ATP-binding/permease protein
MASIVFHSVSFSYPGSPVRLFDALDFGLSEGWAGIIGANGAGKSTLLQLACGILSPEAGQIHRPKRGVYCPQRTDEPMPELASLLASTEGEAYRIRGMLDVEDEYLDRWSTLSHGERKRAQIAACLWARPTLFAVDEPTNHLDTAARAVVYQALRSYRGIGLLVSHDRELLDQLCEHTLFVDPPAVLLRSGGYTDARVSLELESEHARERKQQAIRNQKRLRQELDQRRRHQQKADKGRSKRGISRKDHDAKEKVDRAIVSDGGAGKGLRQLEGRMRQAESEAASIRVRRSRTTGIRLQGQRSPRNALCTVKAGTLPMGPQRDLRIPDLMIQAGDRIALIGPNGIGKSTLVRRIVKAVNLPARDMISIPQEIDTQTSAATLRDVKQRRGQSLGEVMQWVSRLGSDPHQLLDSLLPSPGEVRKLMLALRMADTPALIIMDEPTNHMDLPSIECLESALREYPGGLLLVSHDMRFLSALVNMTWEIVQEDGLPDIACLTVRHRAPRSEDDSPPDE